MKYNYHPFVHNECMLVEKLDVWYLDSGVNKYNVAYCYFFFSLQLILVVGSFVMYKNNSSYLVKGIGKV